MPKKEIIVRHASAFIAYLLVVWGFYRFLFKLPEEIEELIIKPLLWLSPVYFFLKKEKQKVSSIGITSKNFYRAVYLSGILGVLFAIEGLIVNFFKHAGADFSANIGSYPFLVSLGISLVTAVTEEVTFRGYVFSRVWHVTKDELKANLLTSFLWALIHLPITFFWWDFNLSSAIVYLFLTTIFGIGSAFVFARTKNIASSILLHVFWEWPIILFR